ncbi:MAG: hypothetical protein R3F62_13680 [Planctomycetota bacterium]
MLVPARHPSRKTIRLTEDVYRTVGLPFLITFNLRRGDAASEPLGSLLQATFARATAAVPCDVFVWCVMPDHVHTVLAPRLGRSVVEWVGAYKSLASTAARKLGCALGWQRSFHDRVLQPDNLRDAVLYTLLNPVRAGLVHCWEAWPLHGSLEWDLSTANWDEA